MMDERRDDDNRDDDERRDDEHSRIAGFRRQRANGGRRPQIYPAGGDGVNRRVRVRGTGATRLGAARGEHFTPIRRNMPDFAAGAFAEWGDGAFEASPQTR